MNNIRRYLMMSCFFSLIIPPAFAGDYFKSLDQIMRPSANETPVLPCNIKEKIYVLNLLKRDKTQLKPDESKDFSNKDFSDLKMNDHGIVSDQKNNVDYEIYKGNFSNQGIVEYALISTGGSGNYNSVSIYQLIENHLVNAELDKTISHDLLNGGDLGPNFYGYVARPFAVVKQGVTYIRFMDFPASRVYDKSRLMLCTYLWKKNKISLAGPNLSFSPTSGKLIKTKKCIDMKNQNTALT
jgi:hypothetical protein